MKQHPIRPFGIRDKLGYLLGDFGNDFTFILSSSFLLKFYTDVMGMDAAVVGVIMMIARFVDAFTDVTMGRICDRSRVTSSGKFKPWLLRMCGPVAVSSFLIYQSSLSGMSMPFKIGYLAVTYILWGSVFYTAVNIPYGSMASAISADAGDRQSLSTYRSLGGTLAGLVIGAGVPLLAYDTIDGREILNGDRFTVIAGVFSFLCPLTNRMTSTASITRTASRHTVYAPDRSSPFRSHEQSDIQAARRIIWIRMMADACVITSTARYRDMLKREVRICRLNSS